MRDYLNKGAKRLRQEVLGSCDAPGVARGKERGATPGVM